MSNMRCLAFIQCCCPCIPIATDPQAQLPNSTFLPHREPRPPSRWSIPHPRLPRRHQPIRSIPRWIRHPSRRWVCPPILPSHSFHRPGPLDPVSRLLAPSFLVRLPSMSPRPVVVVIESSLEDRGADSSHRADRRWWRGYPSRFLPGYGLISYSYRYLTSPSNGVYPWRPQ